ncbi:hypothetical protein A8A54_10020 [Brucella pseudogrignonensis]|uniref:hypothetical protein n=1 Tax=Brucella pseudogrignonensis TaxID=419475 RepID=UPI0007DAB1A9|nr:hypothetical protein [Brucella pseudogrignonensis]ANG96777.1 hypothetical protein A8A54_10020 [Brucella pseudogrignonensis]
MSAPDELIAKILAASKENDDPAAAEIAAITKKHRTHSQIAEHRRLHRAAQQHIDSVDAYNKKNPEKPMQYRLSHLAYLHSFAYVEKDT